MNDNDHVIKWDTIKVLKARLEYEIARVERADRWVPACAGNETPFLKMGRCFLYVYNHATGKHGFLDMNQDIVFDSLPFDN